MGNDRCRLTDGVVRLNDVEGVICLISTRVGTGLDYSGTGTEFRHLNARFASLETAMTQYH
jgi:hypothetical protein